MDDWITGDEDRDSWQRRLVAIPCGVQLPQAQQKADYERRFVSEYPSIAWHCIAAYAEMHHSDRGYSVSQEMLALKAEQIGGDMEKIQEFTGEVAAGAGHLDLPKIDKGGLLPVGQARFVIQKGPHGPLRGSAGSPPRGIGASRRWRGFSRRGLPSVGPALRLRILLFRK